MALALSDHWVWDFWFAVDGEDTHMFFLQAARTLGDPELRHWNVSIGHAVSRNLIDWQPRKPILAPAQHSDAPDSCTTWTGSVVRHKRQWVMFYTGTSQVEDGKIQRICRATSHDLDHWQRCEAVAAAVHDPSHYEVFDPNSWHDQSWRDPWVVRDPADGRFHMFITSRSAHGPADGRGAIAHAISDDLEHWETRPPVLAPGWFGEMEVPQVERIGNHWYLFCAVSARYHSQAAQRELPGPARTGTIYFIADRLTGPFRALPDPFLHGDAHGSLYAGRLLRVQDQWLFFAFRNRDPDGRFIGEISDPMPVRQHPDGSLSLEREPAEAC
ncbi:MAG: hypothetical protein RQ729_12275 [Wenzhouxiangellaceae bacterium]|nr:hypothetical protein [Wenzhouxiangellaceae bacterium]